MLPILGSHRAALVVGDQGVADLIEFLLPSVHFTFHFSFEVSLVIKLHAPKMIGALRVGACR
jgi:hypothetical protein